MNNRNAAFGTLADEVESTLLNYMRKSNLEPGDLLPKEEELAEDLKVSRHIVREGISRLKGLDLIESRQRRGMVLKHPSAFVGLNKMARARLFTGKDCQDLMELRVAMELGMCEFIYARKTDKMIDGLFALAGSPSTGFYTLEEEVAFHSRLFDFCGNGMARQFRRTLLSAFGSMQVNEDDGLTSPTHFRICEILRDGTADDFIQVMRMHLRPYFN